ncbi:MAG: hypothetical protein Q9165_002038 [Trypethelium subeluteriae]
MAGVAGWKVDQLAEYERSKNYAGGLKACERLLKKSPKDAGLLLQKARFLLTTGNSDGSTEICRELCHREPPVVNEEQVGQIYITLAQNLVAQDNAETIVEVSKDLVELWKAIIKHKPHDGGRLYTLWIKVATEFDRWEEIRMAAQQFQFANGSKAQRDFKADKERVRYYYFLGLTAAQIAIESLPATDKKVNTTAGVLLRHLQNSVQTTVSPPAEAGSGYSIQSYGELRLLYKIYWLQNKTEDVYKLASNPVLGINSAVGQGDAELAHQVARMLREKRMWQELKDYVETILFKSGMFQIPALKPVIMLTRAELEDEDTADVNLWLDYVQSLVGLGEFESKHLDVLKEDVVKKDKIEEGVAEEGVKEAAASRGQALARCSLLSKKLERLELETGEGRRTEEIQNLRRLVSDACAGILKTTSQTWFEDVKSELERISLEDRSRLKDLVQNMVSQSMGVTSS